MKFAPVHAIIYNLLAGQSLGEAIELMLRQLDRSENKCHKECAASNGQAVTLWHNSDSPPAPEIIEQMGGG